MGWARLLLLALALAAVSVCGQVDAQPAPPVDLVVEGIEGDLLANVRAYLEQRPAVDTRRAAERYATRARERAATALEALGHYGAEIESRVTETGGGWRLRLMVTPGEPVRLRNVTIEVRGDGADDDAFERAVAAIGLDAGERLHHGRYEAARNALINTALTRGYFDYTLPTHRIAVHTGEHWADITLIMNSGERYSLGEVRYNETRLAPSLLRRITPYEAGTPYEAAKVAELNRRLYESGYFASVRVNTLREEATGDRVIPVTADVTLRDPNTVGLGVGFSTDEGPRARVSWDRHWLNAAGHKASAQISVSAVRQEGVARYIIPLRDPLRDQLEFNAGLQSEDIQDTRSDRITVGVQRQQVFDSGWRRVQSLRLLEERFEQGADEGRTTLLLPGLAFSRTRARGGLDPYWGDHQDISVEVADEHVVSDITLARGTFTTKWLRRYYRDHRLLFRIEGGAIATSDFEDVPASLRFFAGGDQSVRGYEYQTLAPRDETGELVGGRYRLTGTAEYQYELFEKWRLALFTDAGNAFDDPTTADYKVGSGFGVRWVSPVGPVRFDFAWGVSEEDVPFRLHISLGSPL